MASKKEEKTNIAAVVLPSIIAAIVGIISGTLSYQAKLKEITIPLNATQTVEARQSIVALTPSPTSFPNSSQGSPPIVPLENMLLQGDVPFVWQWAGENWYGRVTLSEMNGQRVINQANMGLIQKTIQDTVLMDGKVFSLAPGTFGTFLINDDGSITIDLAIEKKSRRTNLVGIEIINGILKPVLCYAGSVSYSGVEGSYTGDIILVHDTSLLGASVDEWFKNNQNWFENYLIDR